jgi:threonine synthase
VKDQSRDLQFIDAAGNRYPANGPDWHAADGSPFLVEPALRAISHLSLPPVSLGESPTPVIRHEIAGRPYELKLDFRLPTGSFKDRGARLLVSVLKYLGIDRVVEDSSGNAGASLAAYAAAAGIQCTIVVPASARGPVLNQIRVTGADVERVRGGRDRASRRARQLSQETYYASHIYNPFFIAGTAGVCDEIKPPPDAVVVPVGNGTLLLGLYYGFRRMGVMPRLFAGQLQGVSPVVSRVGGPPRAERGTFVSRRTAPGIAAARPARLTEIADAIVQSSGAAVAVNRHEVVDAQRDLARRGIHVESTSAVAPAAARILNAAGHFTPSDRVMIVLTGSGLKR